MAVTFRSGAELIEKRCRKLKCSMPGELTQAPSRLGVRFMTVWAATPGPLASAHATAMIASRYPGITSR